MNLAPFTTRERVGTYAAIRFGSHLFVSLSPFHSTEMAASKAKAFLSELRTKRAYSKAYSAEVVLEGVKVRDPNSPSFLDLVADLRDEKPVTSGSPLTSSQVS